MWRRLRDAVDDREGSGDAPTVGPFRDEDLVRGSESSRVSSGALGNGTDLQLDRDLRPTEDNGKATTAANPVTAQVCRLRPVSSLVRRAVGR